MAREIDLFERAATVGLLLYRDAALPPARRLDDGYALVLIDQRLSVHHRAARGPSRIRSGETDPASETAREGMQRSSKTS